MFKVFAPRGKPGLQRLPELGFCASGFVYEQCFVADPGESQEPVGRGLTSQMMMGNLSGNHVTL